LFGKVEFDISHRFKDKEVQVNVLRSDGGGVSTINFPPNTLQEGWRVTITPASVKDQKKDHRCDSSNEETKRVASPPMQINVYDQSGRRVEREFSSPLKLSSFADLDEDRSDRNLCFGYRKDSDQATDDERDWRCLSRKDPRLIDTRTRGVAFVHSETSHLTTFAVLLGSVDIHSRNNCDDELDWIAIASLVLVGSYLLLVLLCALGLRFHRFRAWLGGYAEDTRLTRVVKKIENKQ